MLRSPVHRHGVGRRRPCTDGEEVWANGVLRFDPAAQERLQSNPGDLGIFP
jgi:hypothetical protein